MLVIRDLFYGVHRFTDQLAHLDISRAVLTDRLNTLTEAGLVRRQEGDGHPGYELTEAGVALWPSLFALWSWGQRFAGDGTPGRSFAHATCHTRLEDTGRCPRCGSVPGPAEVLAMPPPTLAPHTPLIIARSAGVRARAATRPRLDATIPALPTPSTRRPRMNGAVDVASAQTSEPAAISAFPATKTRRRPWSSASAPAVNRTAARATLVELRIQVWPFAPAASARARLQFCAA
jgi:DNA-binding HxlR family transcriptional regulator